jgi:hypothetical protein
MFRFESEYGYGYYRIRIQNGYLQFGFALGYLLDFEDNI